ncbi:hypothetical protein KU74_12430 [Pectobacterium brasiliense]|uniref:Morphogenetic protein n=1 Tax=Pectobacterium brasiliense TaxID=180957 RepID=A0A0M2F0W0_9GAMM|nr:hypothetical protein [Pectobacterium brasiliense]KGA34272.1 hypothetical protein KU74_12430 [Pectobacterium brasiliense]
MKERGMIFNGEMVRATIDGRKTQTRRIVKPQYRHENQQLVKCDDGLFRWWLKGAQLPHGAPVNPQHGKVGDRIWVRETSGLQIRRDALGGTGEFRVYRASNPDAIRYKTASGEIAPIKWVPSIHMPRYASRITLEITDVRVELLNNISEEDAQAEGVESLHGGYWRHYQPEWTQHQLSAKGSFATLWKSIYGEENWNSNPWVWVTEFKQIK